MLGAFSQAKKVFSKGAFVALLAFVAVIVGFAGIIVAFTHGILLRFKNHGPAAHVTIIYGLTLLLTSKHYFVM
jgi:hypothetical protein